MEEDMTYNVTNGSGNFLMTSDNKGRARAALLLACKEGEIKLSLEMLLEPDLEEMLDHVALDTVINEEGDIVHLILREEYESEEIRPVLKIIAPYVKAGSYQMFIGDDGQWAWVFDKDEETDKVEFHEEDVICVLRSRAEKLAEVDETIGWKELEEKINQRRM
jgi:hypothetical protein